MLLMMLGRLEPMLQYTLCYDSICVCSSVACTSVLHMHAFICGMQYIALVMPSDTFLDLRYNAAHDAGSL